MTLSRLSTSSVYNVQVNNGLLGAGGWASVIATTGSPTTGTYTDGNGVQWQYWQWNSSGSVTTTAGLVDVVIVGGGGGGTQRGGGGAGAVRDGIRSLTSATHAVTIGAAGSSGNTSAGNRAGNGGNSLLGSLPVAGGGSGGFGGDDYGSTWPMAQGSNDGGGSGGGFQQNTWGGYVVGATAGLSGAGISSSITGSAVSYGGRGSSANTGNGASGQGAGSSGVVIIRVPTNPGLTVPQQPQGLSGVGNWAFVTATTGSPTKGSYTDVNGSWTYYQWTSSGSVTVTAGVVDRLIVAGGSGGNGASHGGSGLAVPGLQYLSAGSKSVVVGAGSAGGQTPAASVVNAGPSALDGLNFRSGIEAGFSVTSSITGTSQVYAQSNASPARAGFGDGGSYVGNVSGSSGTVIIRVPSQFALA